MKKDNFIKGVLIGIAFTFIIMTSMGFKSSLCSRLNPMYVKVVK